MTAMQGNTQDTAASSGQALTSSSTVNNKTSQSFATLIASTNASVTGMLIQLAAGSLADVSYLVDIATGPTSSETVIIPNLYFASPGTLEAAIFTYWFPGLTCGAGVRLSARAQASTASAVLRVGMKCAFDPIPGPQGASIAAYGPNIATSDCLAVVAAADPGGPWSAGELTSNSAALNGFSIAIGKGTDTAVVARYGIAIDLGIGGVGAETVIIDDYQMTFNASRIGNSHVMPFMPIPIQAGSRLVIRIREDYASLDPRVAMYGLL